MHLTRKQVLGAGMLGLSGCSPKPLPMANPKQALLVDAARKQTRQWVTYDSGYTPIAYPNGDVPPSKGVCADVIIRAYRAL